MLSLREFYLVCSHTCFEIHQSWNCNWDQSLSSLMILHFLPSKSGKDIQALKIFWVENQKISCSTLSRKKFRWLFNNLSRSLNFRIQRYPSSLRSSNCSNNYNKSGKSSCSSKSKKYQKGRKGKIYVKKSKYHKNHHYDSSSDCSQSSRRSCPSLLYQLICLIRLLCPEERQVYTSTPFNFPYDCSDRDFDKYREDQILIDYFMLGACSYIALVFLMSKRKFWNDLPFSVSPPLDLTDRYFWSQNSYLSLEGLLYAIYNTSSCTSYLALIVISFINCWSCYFPLGACRYSCRTDIELLSSYTRYICEYIEHNLKIQEAQKVKLSSLEDQLFEQVKDKVEQHLEIIQAQHRLDHLDHLDQSSITDSKIKDCLIKLVHQELNKILPNQADRDQTCLGHLDHEQNPKQDHKKQVINLTGQIAEPINQSTEISDNSPNRRIPVTNNINNKKNRRAMNPVVGIKQTRTKPTQLGPTQLGPTRHNPSNHRESTIFDLFKNLNTHFG